MRRSPSWRQSPNFAVVIAIFLGDVINIAAATAQCGAGERLVDNDRCVQCSTGLYMSRAQHNDTECDLCAAGTYAPLPGMSTCWTCPHGSSSTAGSSSCTLTLSCNPCTDRSALKVRAVVHGQRSDLFWLRVERAMRTAAYQLKIDFEVYLQIRQSQDAMADMITDVVNNEAPDVLLVTIPGATVAEAVRAAVQKVHVFSLNSGLTDFEALGVKAHLSMDEWLGGYQAAGELAKAFGSNAMQACILLNSDEENSALEQRRDGFKKGCEDLGKEWLPEVRTNLNSVDDHKSSVAGIIADYVGSTSAESGGLGLLLAAGGTAFGARASYVDAGRPSSVLIGSFDLGEDVLSGLEAGDLVFGIDQQEWFQGYMSVLVATLYLSTGNLMAPKVYPTGPAFITQPPSIAEASKTGEAFPVCNCPWVGGLENALQCSEAAGIDPVGNCPLETNDCTVECADARSFKFRGIVHGHEADAFWFVAKAGAEQAANDLRLMDFEVDLWGVPGSERADAFTEERMAQKLRDTADDQSIDGIFVSIPSPNMEDAITYAAARTRVVTINSGYDVSAGLNPPGGFLVGHVGMHELNAGAAAGRLLADAGATKIVVVDHASYNSALIDRLAGAQSEQRLSVVHIDLIGDGVATDNDDAIAEHVATILEADPSIDGLLAMGSSMVRASRNAMRQAGRDFIAGSFDSSPVLIEAIDAGEFFIFAVDQQQYMQGYMGVMALFIHALTQQRLASHVIESGPYFITALEPSKDACIALPWTISGEDGIPFVGERLLPVQDAAFTVGFPVCEYAGSCLDDSLYFNFTLGQCRPCNAGLFKNATLDACIACPSGRSTNGETGATFCAACPVGKYALSGAPDCTFCSRGTFQGSVGQTSCISCEAPLTTQDIAQTSNASCICPSGTYRDLGGTCQACPEAMNCELGSDLRFYYTGEAGAYPTLQRGHMSKTSSPLEAFRCYPEGRCPGGAPGSCTGNMDPSKVACGQCVPDSYESGDECKRCSGGADILPFVGVAVLGVAGVGVITIVINRNLLMQSNATLMCVLMFGMLVTGCQTLTVLDELALEWDDLGPLSAILSVMRLLSFNLSVIKVGCVTGSNPVNSYLARQLVAPLSIPFVLVVLLIKKHRLPQTNVRVELTNTVGTVFSIFLISVVVSAVSPFICYDHPTHPDGEAKSSMRSATSILCFEGGDHSTMMAIGLVVFFCVPVPFLAVAAWFSYNYPSYVRTDNAKMLSAFRFLYFRYQPTRYYHGLVLLLRNAAVPLVPALIRNEALQVIVLCMIFQSYLLLQQQWNPWRVYSANIIEGVISAALMLLLLCGAMATDMTASRGLLAGLAVTAFVTFASVLLIAMIVGLIRRFIPSPYYHHFICHHKRDAAAQARLLKLILVERGKGKQVFIDSDDLQELDELFDTVKTRVGMLVVYLTRETLSRPWCAGEIVTAFGSSRVTVASVYHPSFKRPTDEEMLDMDKFLDLSSCNLAEYGMTHAHVREAFSKLLDSTTKAVAVDVNARGSQRMESVASRLLSPGVFSAPTSQKVSNYLPMPTQTGMVVLQCDKVDDEAVAATVILKMKIFQEIDRICSDGVCVLCDINDSEEVSLRNFITASRAVGVLLSRSSLTCLPQLVTILAGTGSHGTLMIPITLPSFAFPGDDFYRSQLPVIIPSHTSKHAKLMQTFFKTIAVNFAVSASDHVLDTQAHEVVRRVAAGSMSGTKVMTSTRVGSSGGRSGDSLKGLYVTGGHHSGPTGSREVRISTAPVDNDLPTVTKQRSSLRGSRERESNERGAQYVAQASARAPVEELADNAWMDEV